MNLNFNNIWDRGTFHYILLKFMSNFLSVYVILDIKIENILYQSEKNVWILVFLNDGPNKADLMDNLVTI